MPKGEYRDTGGWVLVNYEDRFQMPMHRSDYEDHGYRPAFDALPLRPHDGANGRTKRSGVAPTSESRRWESGLAGPAANAAYCLAPNAPSASARNRLRASSISVWNAPGSMNGFAAFGSALAFADFCSSWKNSGCGASGMSTFIVLRLHEGLPVVLDNALILQRRRDAVGRHRRRAEHQRLIPLALVAQRRAPRRAAARMARRQVRGQREVAELHRVAILQHAIHLHRRRAHRLAVLAAEIEAALQRGDIALHRGELSRPCPSSASPARPNGRSAHGCSAGSSRPTA